MKKALGNTDVACMSENVMFMSGLLGLEGDNRNLLHVLTLHISRRKQDPTKAHRGKGGSARILSPYSTEVCRKLHSRTTIGNEA
jgi:hypothetical protein